MMDGIALAGLVLSAFSAGGIVALIPLVIVQHRKVSRLPKRGDRYDG